MYAMNEKRTDKYPSFSPILFYPCNQYLYDLDWRFGDVRAELREREYTKEILIAEFDRFTRVWGTTFDADATLSMPGYTDGE